MVYLRTDKENYFIKVDLKYDLGGWNYATGDKESRSYKLHLTPIEREHHQYTDTNGNIREYDTETYKGFSGYKISAEPINRNSVKAKQDAIRYFKNNLNIVKLALSRIEYEQKCEVLDEFNENMLESL